MMKDRFNFRIHYRLISYTLGRLLLFETALMMIPTLYSAIAREPILPAWILSVGIAMGISLLLIFTFRNNHEEWGRHDSYLVVTSIWVAFSLISIIPLRLSGTVPDFTDGFFESMSGFTTTGASIIPSVEDMQHSILLWRAIMQWIGGMGIIVLSLAFGFGGMQLYMAEVSGVEKEQRLRPKLNQTAKVLWKHYLLLTVVLITLLMIGGMCPLDAICHAFATISAGGFGTHNDSIAYFHSGFIEYVIILFMIIGSLNFSITYMALHKKWRQAIKDEECRDYIGVILIVGILLTILNVVYSYDQFGTVENTFRKSLFNLVNMISGTGFSDGNFMLWHPSTMIILLLALASGGCTGSACGGIKIARSAVFVKNSYEEFKRRLHAHAIIPVKFNGHAVDVEIINSVMAFIMLYFGIAIVGSFIMMLAGLSPIDAIGCCLSGLGNQGSGFGSYVSGNFQDMPIVAKWTYSVLMLIGRLEIFTVICLFTPAFWRR